jgi:hypothetical protein
MELLMPNHIKCWAEWFGLIDISWLDWAYKSSTCDVMYRRQRRHLYYGGQIWKYYSWPLHRNSPFIGELRCQAIQTEHGPYITKRTQKAVYIVRYLCLDCISHKVYFNTIRPD